MKKFLLSFVAAMICALSANAEIWKKVTSAPDDWSGKYLIACDNGEDWAVLDGSRSGDPNSGNLQSTMNFKPYSLNAEGNIETTDCDYYVTIAPSGNGYTLCTASGWYIGNNADSNALGTTANAELAFISTITLNATQGVLITATEGGSVLRYNATNGQDRFRFYKSSTYTNQQKIALYKLEETQAPVEPETENYIAAASASDIKAGQEIIIINRYGWGAGTWRSSDYMWYHNNDMDQAENNGNPMFVYDGDVNVSGCPTSFLVEDAGNGAFYLKDLATGKYLNGAYSLSQSDEPTTAWSFDCTDTEKRYFDVYYYYNESKRYLSYGSWVSGGPLIAASADQEQPKRIYIKGGAGSGETPVDPVVPTTTFKGVVTPNLTSVSSLADLEGIQLTFVDADQVSISEYGDGIYVQSRDGSKFYAIWHPGYNGTYEINGNIVTLYNFFTDNSDGYFDELNGDVKTLYFEDYGTFDVSNADADWDGYCQTFSVAYEGAPVAQPFELIVKNNNIVCANGAKVEAAEYGVASDFYLDNQGLTAAGKTATLYKDGNAMSFAYTMVSNNGISFYGGSSQITEPGTYTLEVPAGTYVDAAGNPSIAFYGTWVVIQKDEPVVDPTTKDKYTIRLDGTDYYFTTTEVKDNSVTTYSISTTPEYFYIEPSGNGYTIKSADTDKWVGYDVISTWDFSNDEKVWLISSLEGEPTLIRKNSSKGFGVDNKFEGAGVYTDKSYQYWIIEKVVEVEPEPTIWNGNINYPTAAASIDDLLTFSIEFEEASEVKASNLDVLAVIYDETGDPYAIALCNGTVDAFGSLSVDKSVATVSFQKIADLGADLQTSAKAAALRIGGFANNGNARVAFAGKSFVVDGQLVTDTLTQEYTFGGKAPTGISTIATDAASTLFDLQGRRVRAAQQGIYVVNGKKVVK